jgi:methylphosphotriester-DNA--protein-cysteine methyltransferase
MGHDSRRTFEAVLAVFRRRPGATIDEVAATLRIHRATVRKAIRQETGLCADEWHEQFMLDSLCKFFQANGLASIKEAAAWLEYSANGLRRFVKRRTGLTPTAVRGSCRS